MAEALTAIDRGLAAAKLEMQACAADLEKPGHPEIAASAAENGVTHAYDQLASAGSGRIDMQLKRSAAGMGRAEFLLEPSFPGSKSHQEMRTSADLQQECRNYAASLEAFLVSVNRGCSGIS